MNKTNNIIRNGINKSIPKNNRVNKMAPMVLAIVLNCKHKFRCFKLVLVK